MIEEADDESVKQQFGVGIFAGDSDNLDVERAIDELQRAGFRVARMRERLTVTLCHPLDYFIEIYFECPDAKVYDVWQRMNGIVAPYGGYVDNVGEIPEGHVPFKECFDSAAWEIEAGARRKAFRLIEDE